MKQLYTVKELEDFAGGRFLNKSLYEKFTKDFTLIKDTLYRGMPFPKHLVKEGTIIEEWYGSSHWSLDKQVAINFADTNINGYISDDYYDELVEELGEDNVDFIKLIMVINNVEGLELYRILKENNIYKWNNEKEITLFNKDFIIKKINIIDDVYYANVDVIHVND